MSSEFQSYIGLAHNPNTGECEWSVFTGRQALVSAEYRVEKWTSASGWIGFVRPVDEVVTYFPTSADNTPVHPDRPQEFV